MFAKGAQFISNNIGYHFYKLTGDDIALVYSGILILMFIAAIGSTQEFTICLSGLFALSLVVYILSTIYGFNSNHDSTQNCHSDSLPFARNGWWNKLSDSLLVILSLAMQSVDLARREDVGLAPFRLASLSTIYMFTLTGIRKNCLILVWFISMIFRLTVVQTSSSMTEMAEPNNTEYHVTSTLLNPLLSVINSLHYFALGLLLYEVIYLTGTEIVRLRLRPRVILQDFPNITKIEHSVFSIFYHQYSLLPPITLSQYDHLLLLLHIGMHQVLSRLHVRQKRLFSKLQAELIRQTIENAPRDNDERGSLTSRQETLTEDALDDKIRNVRMRERVWSMDMKFDPSNIMFRGKMQSSENLNKAVSENEALWRWHSKEAIICEASLPARYQDFKTTSLGVYTDLKLERWFLTWSLVSTTRLLTAAQKVLIGYFLLGLLSNLGVFNDILPSIIVKGFRSKTALALYLLRLGSFILSTALLLPKIIYKTSRRKLEWVDLAERQILKYRILGLYILLNAIIDSALVAEQFKNTTTYNTLLARNASFLQQITFLPFLLAVPPHVLALVLGLTVVIMLCLTAIWPVETWQMFYDMTLIFGGCVSCVLFVSVPYYQVLRALFATYAAPYLLYLEALRPRASVKPSAREDSENTENTRHKSIDKTIRSSIRVQNIPNPTPLVEPT